MIDWEAKWKELGFDSEKNMWEVMLTSLRNNDKIAEYLGVSRGSVQRRRLLLGIAKSAKRGRTYRKAVKKQMMMKVPDEVWVGNLEQVQEYVKEKFGEEISLGYISKFKRERS